MTDDRPILTDEQYQRFEACLPKLLDLFIDIVEGRRFVAIETLQTGHTDHGPAYTTTLMICDNPAAGQA